MVSLFVGENVIGAPAVARSGVSVSGLVVVVSA